MKRRLIFSTLAITLAALLVAGAVNVWMTYQREMTAARQNLQELLILMDAQSAITDPEGVLEQFRQAAPEKRLTIIRTDGSVAADTEKDPATMENHLDRSEVRQAMGSGWGEATRGSDTVAKQYFYVAKRFADGMVGRASMPLATIDALVWHSVGGLMLALAVGLLLAVALSGRMAKTVLRPLHAVAGAIQGVLDGAPTTALERYQNDDEVRPILRYADKLVERLSDALEAARAERDKVNLILDCMDEGLILLDGDGGVLAANPSARTLLGANGEYGVHLMTRAKRVREAVAAAAETEKSMVLDLEDPAVEGRELRMFLSPVSGRLYEGKNVGTAILISDVTELKRAEGIRAEFTANVSHELKTPLTSIKGFTDMLSGGMVENSADQKRFITMIGVEADRLIALINDTLELSELESVSIEQCDESTAILPVVREVAELLETKAAEAGVGIEVAGMDCVAAIPAGRLKEVVLNLMENAVKYNVPGGRVTVAVEAADGMARVMVSDTGVGIPPEALERVFERFFRVDKGRDRKKGGTGLGLAIVKHIARLYGGSVSVESAVGEGSTFTVTLPS